MRVIRSRSVPEVRLGALAAFWHILFCRSCDHDRKVYDYVTFGYDYAGEVRPEVFLRPNWADEENPHYRKLKAFHCERCGYVRVL